MKKTEILRARVDARQKSKAEKVFSQLGLSTGDAINIFLTQVVIQKGIPFSLTTRPHLTLENANLAEIEERYMDRIPNEDTHHAISEELKHSRRHRTSQSLLKALKS